MYKFCALAESLADYERGQIPFVGLLGVLREALEKLGLLYFAGNG